MRRSVPRSTCNFADSRSESDPDDDTEDTALLPNDPAAFHPPPIPPPGFDTEEEQQVKLKYPRSVFFIVTNEFCERFTYYGLRTVLSLYFTSALLYSEDKATVLYHAFAMLCYFFPILGGIIADSWLGRYNTILYLSVIYSAGSILLSFASSNYGSVGNGPSSYQEPLTIVGLLLIALGTGGIKPCVSTFGGDQFKLPEQRLQLARFFSIFYFAINSGSLISTFITPIFRQDIKCFGQDTCYPLAFGVPAVIMVVSLVVFVCGRPLYKIQKPQGNVLVRFCACIGSAIWNRKRPAPGTKQRWIDHADPKYDEGLRNDTLAVLKVLVVFLPVPIFWALFDQQGSRWTFQAVNMNGRIGSFVLKPDQMQVVNPIFIIIFLPIMDALVYPCLGKMRLLRKPLSRIFTGGVLACLSFVISAFLEMQLEHHYPVPLTNDLAQVRIFNMAPCRLNLTSDQFGSKGPNVVVDPMGMHAELALKAIKETELRFKATGCSNKPTEYTFTTPLTRKTARSVYLFQHSNGSIVLSAASGLDTVTKKSDDVNPTVRFGYFFSSPKDIQLKQSGSALLKSFKVNDTFGSTPEYSSIAVGTYDVVVEGKTVKSNVLLDVSGTYSILVTEASAASVAVMQPNVVHMLWLMPQYIVITVGEVMFSVTGLEFSFTQAPASMKSVLTSMWLLCVAVGNLVVVIVAEAEIFESRVWEFVLFAGLMLLDMLIFAWIAMKYKYRDETVSSSSEDATVDVTLDSSTNGMHMNGSLDSQKNSKKSTGL